MRPIEAMRRFLRVPARRRRLLARALPMLALATLRLRLRGPQLIQAALLSPTDPPAGDDTGRHAEHIADLAWSIAAASRLLPGHPACLAQSLTLWAWLRRDGIGSRLRIGVSRDSAGIAAHAWLEIDGHAINERPDVARHFLPLGYPQVQRQPTAPAPAPADARSPLERTGALIQAQTGAFTQDRDDLGTHLGQHAEATRIVQCIESAVGQDQ